MEGTKIPSKKNKPNNRFATIKEALSDDFLNISKLIQEIHHNLRLADHAEINKERMLWASGILKSPEFYASRLWEYPWVIQNASLKPNMHCLDIGSGTTAFPIFLHDVQKIELTVLDPDVKKLKNRHIGFGISENFMRECLKRKIRVLSESMHRISMPDNSVDRVFCISVLEHVNPAYFWKKGVKEIYRILKPNGLALITMDLSNGKFFVNPFDLICYSGLTPSGEIDIRFPEKRFGYYPPDQSSIDVFGLILQKDAFPVVFSLPDKKVVALHELMHSQCKELGISDILKKRIPKFFLPLFRKGNRIIKRILN